MASTLGSILSLPLSTSPSSPGLNQLRAQGTATGVREPRECRQLLVLGFSELSGAAKLLQATEAIVTWPPGPKQGPGPSLTVTPISEGCHLALLVDGGRGSDPPGHNQGIDVDVKIAGVRCSAPADEHWVFKMHPSA